MALRIASVSEMWTKDVFTDKGNYCGKVEDLECDLRRFKIRSIIIRAVKGSYLSKMLGGKKGMIVPFPMIQAVGEVVLIKHITTPASEETVDIGENKTGPTGPTGPTPIGME